ncbi:MAG: aldo/keto reductase [Planctomycetota bacterium]|nr:aldo/keto reductase [Planctomycetota bacterium]
MTGLRGQIAARRRNRDGVCVTPAVCGRPKPTYDAMNSIPHRPLGRTGLQVSELGFGAVEIGQEYGIRVKNQANLPPPEVAVEIVRRALEMGVNVIDTARGYGDSERIIGAAIAGQRDDVVLMTKVSCTERQPHGAELRAAVNQSVETSLEMLRCSWVDVLSVHSASADVLARGEVVEAFERLRVAGKARFLGATVYTEEEALAALRDPRIDVLQIAYSLLDPSMADRVIPLAAERGVGIVARSVLHRGVLTPKGAAGSTDEQRLHTHALKYRYLFDEETRTLPQVAVRFALSEPRLCCALLGMDTIAQVETNLANPPRAPYSDDQIVRAISARPADPWSILPGAGTQ